MWIEVDDDEVTVKSLQESYRNIRQLAKRLGTLERPMEFYEQADLESYAETALALEKVLRYYMVREDANKFFKEMNDAYEWTDFNPGNSDDDWNSGVPGGC